jgi:hypothetical protein
MPSYVIIYCKSEEVVPLSEIQVQIAQGKFFDSPALSYTREVRVVGQVPGVLPRFIEEPIPQDPEQWLTLYISYGTLQRPLEISRYTAPHLIREDVKGSLPVAKYDLLLAQPQRPPGTLQTLVQRLWESAQVIEIAFSHFIDEEPQAARMLRHLAEYLAQRLDGIIEEEEGVYDAQHNVLFEDEAAEAE